MSSLPAYKNIIHKHNIHQVCLPTKTSMTNILIMFTRLGVEGVQSRLSHCMPPPTLSLYLGASVSLYVPRHLRYIWVPQSHCMSPDSYSIPGCLSLTVCPPDSYSIPGHLSHCMPPRHLSYTWAPVSLYAPSDTYPMPGC